MMSDRPARVHRLPVSAPPTRRLALALRDVGWIKGERTFFSIDLDVAVGEVLLITGVNGSGKSALLSVLAGAAPVSHGMVARHVPAELVDADQLSESLVGERLKSDALTRAARDLDEPGLVKLRPVNRQSAGERQRQALAVALASPAELILFESPTTALDTDGRELCVAAIRYLAAKQHKTVIATTVDPELLVLLNEAGIVSLADESLHVVRKPIQQMPSATTQGDRT